MLKQAHLQGAQSQYTKANLAKELAFLQTGHILNSRGDRYRKEA